MPSAEAMAQDYMRDKPAPTIQMAYARVLMGQNRWVRRPKSAHPLAQSLLDTWWMPGWHKRTSCPKRQMAQSTASHAAGRKTLPKTFPTRHSAAMSCLKRIHWAVTLRFKPKTMRCTPVARQNPYSEALLNVQSLKAQALAKQGKLAQGRAPIRATPARNDAEADAKAPSRSRLAAREQCASRGLFAATDICTSSCPTTPILRMKTAIWRSVQAKSMPWKTSCAT